MSEGGRAEILQEAIKVITQDRQDQYGHAEDVFALIGQLWSAWLGMEVSRFDVAMMMVLLKVARANHNPGHRDNLVDLAGYSGLAWEQVGRS